MFAARAVFAAGQRRAFSASARNLSKVTVLGAAGGIGQPLSLLLKMNPRVTELALYDIRGGPGMHNPACVDTNEIRSQLVV
ncbi:hypothetical protein NPX13_g9744 [Xylaria arbuscula]|uniref:malate dehydrogenase n=1 Tax=Xylaria arbuscula TaxID=114810 RepID=A0A9W8N639_9PEZI|nr:hypothetical protein NPX13_g9744 [Xylaria arbuscula]